MSSLYKHNRLSLLVLAGLLVLAPLAALQPPGFAASYAEPAIPPEVVYAHDLRQRITVPQRVNVNKASLNDLLTLPGMDENMALKLLRMRPIQTKEDFLQMPFVSPRNVQLLLQRIDGKIEF